MFYASFVPCDDDYDRERRLNRMNALGKFSLVDSYVLILFVVAFRCHIGVSESLGLDLYVTPVYGFYSFLLATCLSLFLGHAMLFFHRKAAGNETISHDVLSGKECIMAHSFQGHGDEDPKRLSFLFQIVLVGLMLCTMVLLVLGFLQESFSFEFGGLAGFAMSDESNVATYSAISIGAVIPQSLKESAGLGAAFLQLTYFLFTLFSPLACLVVSVFLSVWPMRIKTQRTLLVVAEALNAWSAIEVFLLSIVAAVLQISQFAAFLVGDKCDTVNKVAEAIFDTEALDPVCFTVNATVNSNCWYLVVGTVLNSWLVSFMLRFSHAAIEERATRLALGNEGPADSEIHRPSNHGWTIVQSLSAIPVFGQYAFAPQTEQLDEGGDRNRLDRRETDGHR